MAEYSYPDVTAGQRLRPALVMGGLPTLVLKTAAESVTSSTVLQDDNELTYALEADATYIVDAYLIAHQTVDAATAIDINTEWSVPSGTSGGKWCFGPETGMTSREDTSMVSSFHLHATDRRYGLDASGDTVAIHEHLIVVTTTAGDLTFRWAQDSSNANATVVTDNSHMIVQRVA